jgi:hypothetical protein
MPAPGLPVGFLAYAVGAGAESVINRSMPKHTPSANDINMKMGMLLNCKLGNMHFYRPA